MTLVAVSHASEHHTYLLAELVGEDGGGLGLVQRTGDLAEGLGHEAGLQADVAVPHLALDLGPRHERGHRVDHDDVDGTRPDQHVHDLQRLLTGVRLGDEQLIGVHAQLLGVVGVERVLGVDERGDAAGLLRIRHRVQRHGRVVGQHAVGDETVGTRENYIERRLEPTVLDRDDLLVGIRKCWEHPQVLHDRLGSCREPVSLPVAPLNDLRQALPRARESQIAAEDIARNPVESSVAAAVITQVPEQARQIRDVLELWVPG